MNKIIVYKTINEIFIRIIMLAETYPVTYPLHIPSA